MGNTGIINNSYQINNINAGTMQTIINGGTIYNGGDNALILNNIDFINSGSGTIYIYNNGTITNNNYFENGGTIEKADGSSTCGVGTINGTNPVVGPGTIGNNCPP